MSSKILYTLVLLSTALFSLVAQPTTQIKYLSGTDKDNKVQWDFFCTDGRRSGEWTKIGVPSCWEQEGFGGYNYGHDLPFEDRAQEQGLYKHAFNVPSDWQGKEVKLVFEGSMTDTEVKINGQLAGEIHQGAFYEFKYSITDKLKYGAQNTLEVKVSKVSANESINHAERKADFWIFGGIYRPVYLQVFPTQRIERMAIDAQASGKINADLFVEATTATNLQLKLLDVNGNKVQDLKIHELAKSEGRWNIKTAAIGIKTWNPEQPNLYQLSIDLVDTDGNIVHHVQQRIGFRTVEVRDADGIYVNGQRIKFKGVNRHSFHPESGRTTSKSLSIEHALMMKDMNMNAVRMSHYPPDVHFLDVCDSLGLFVIDEVCTWHTPKLDTEVGRKIVKETVVRDVNHPSILLWANGNETGWNTDLDDDYAIWDIQKREVIHPWNIFRKTNTLHYFRYHALANDAYSKDKILFPTEFLHGLYDGGHGAGLEDYWDRMWNMPTNAGGFLWDFADEGLIRTDKGNTLDTDGNHAADGIVGPYGEKEASYFTIKEVWSPVYIQNRYIREQFDGRFEVENRYHFTNLSECKMVAKWVNFESPNGQKQSSILSESTVTLPSLEPHRKGSFKVDLPANWQSADALYLTVIDPHGREVFTWSFAVKAPKYLNAPMMNQNSKGVVKVSNSGDQIIAQGKGFKYVFAAKTGMLKSVTKGDQLIPFNNGPVILQHKDKVDTVFIKKSKTQTEIVAIFASSNKMPEWASEKKFSSDTLKWTIYPNGLLDLKVSFKGKRIIEGVKGISFSFPESEVEGMKWLGDGPYRVWRNRTKGTRFQVWENDYNNTVTGESGYVYPEFKGFFSSLYWVKVKSKNNRGFTVYCHTPHTYLRMLTPQAPTPGSNGDSKGRMSPVFPEGDISFVKNIPAIGTKFQDPETMGPQGNPENYYGNSDDPLIIELTFEF